MALSGVHVSAYTQSEMGHAEPTGHLDMAGLFIATVSSSVPGVPPCSAKS